MGEQEAVPKARHTRAPQQLRTGGKYVLVDGRGWLWGQANHGDHLSSITHCLTDLPHLSLFLNLLQGGPDTHYPSLWVKTYLVHKMMQTSINYDQCWESWQIEYILFCITLHFMLTGGTEPGAVK